MADGARFMTISLLEVFGEETVRQMCWSHVYRYSSNKDSRLGPLTKGQQRFGKCLTPLSLHLCLFRAGVSDSLQLRVGVSASPHLGAGVSVSSLL